jgi:hypothetical protein
MGYRLHFGKVHKITWDGGYFSGSETQLVENMFREELPNFWADENADRWELPKDELEAYIRKLKKNPRSVNKYFKDSEDEYVEKYTNADMVGILTDMLENSEPDDDYVTVEWF